MDGTIIRNVIQHTVCFDCGMGLCDAQEWHPSIACETFKRERDGRFVWVMLTDLIANGAAPWL